MLLVASLAAASCNHGDGGPVGTECAPDGLTEACYPGSPAVRNIGACQDGTRTCEAGAWGQCAGHTLPKDEICDDERDDDCNGAPDDGCPCTEGSSRACYGGPPATLNMGACHAGEQACTAGTWSPECVGVVLPEPEQCDDVDNDCNGADDDDCECVDGAVESCYGGPSGTDGIGACQAGSHTCAGGWWPESCTDEVRPSEEICNGVDDDCDGRVDQESCLVRLERFWNTDICSHQYKVATATPDAGYVWEEGNHFYVYETAGVGTVPLYQRAKGSLHLVTLDPDEGSGSGYTETETLGYVVPPTGDAWAVGDGLPTAVCRYTTTVCPDHVLWLATEPPASGYTAETCLGSVWGWP